MPDLREISNLPWLIGDDEIEAIRGINVGGRVVRYTAAAALNVGDAVFISAAGTVNKSTVAADHLKRAGIVVGGEAIGAARVAVQRAADVGKAAAAAGQAVLVAVDGSICYAVAQAAIAAGAAVKPDLTTAGRVLTATIAAAADFGRVLGLAIEAAAAAGDKIRIQIALY